MSETALSVVPAGSVETLRWGMQREQLYLLKRTIAKGTTDDEFALFMNTSNRLGLDPFAKQIYAIKRSTYDRESRSYVDTMQVQVAIDGFRAVADRTGENDGQDGPFWCGDDGVWVEAWLRDEPPAAAMVRVYRKGRAKPFTGVASYRSYVQTTKDGKPVSMWERMPDNQLAKCAEALALRKAFPSQLSGVYTPDEMGQADNVERGAPAQPPGPALPAQTEEPAIFALVDAADTEEQLQSLAGDLGKLTGKLKERARTKYGARLKWLREEAKRRPSPRDHDTNDAWLDAGDPGEP